MDKRCILLAGDYGVGKSTLAKYLEKIIPNSVNLSFANKIREKLNQRLNIGDDLYSKPSKEYIRYLIKGYGEYLKEKISKDIWADLVCREFFFSLSKDILIIDDFRFLDEYHFMCGMFQKKVKIVYIGEKINSYDLEKIYNLSDIYLPKHPNFKELNNDRFL